MAGTSHEKTALRAFCVAMTDVIKPRNAKEVEEAVRWALGNDKALEVVGQGTKRSIGRPSQTDLTLDLSGLSGVTLYEPEELVLSAKAGTPLAEIETLLDASNQQLAFEPMDYGPLLGGQVGQGTIGGTIAANLSGPRRIKAGAARDHFLGLTAVTGRAETIKSGGRVVKNVTGYDMCKVLAGSWGTLAAMTDVTIKVLPKAETEATVIVQGLDDARACAAMAAAMGSSCDVSGAAHLPDHVASYFDGLPNPEASTALRLEGFPPSVKHRKEALAALMKPFGPVALLDEKNSRALWRSVRQVKPFAGDAARARPLWRISTAPSRGHEIAAAITPAAQMFYDWAGGLLWVAMPYADEPDATSIRAAVRSAGGHATLVRAPAAVRAAVDVFEPQEAALRALSKRVKEGFDPKGVLNPGRMWAGV
jgi:glycolate oxidase FAD binding subunit